MWYTLLAVIVALLILWKKWTYGFWERNKVPYREPTILVGNLGEVLTMKKHLGVALKEWYNEFKEYSWFGYYQMSSPAIVARDLDLIKDILLKDFPSFHANEVNFDPEVDTLFASNPFALNGDKWKGTRSILSPLFTLNRCKLLFPQMQPAIERMKNYLNKNGPSHIYDAKQFSSQFTTENVVKCGYSIDAGCFDDPNCEFRTMSKKIFQPSVITGLKFLLSVVLPITVKIFRFRFISMDISVWLSRVLKDNFAERKKRPLPQEDILHWLSHGIENDKMDEDEAISHAFSFFIEGFETSSSVMAFALYALAKNTDIQSRLRDEITDVIDQHDGKFNFDALQHMFYLDSVIQETLRMHGPGLNLAKRCTKPYTMPLLPGQTSPFVCQPGTVIMIPIYAIHVDEKVYPNPDIFDPDRFSEEERKIRHRAAFLPFGEGPRMCLGIKFALTQIKLAVAHLVKDYEIILEGPTQPIEIDPTGLMYTSKENLMVKFKPLRDD